MILVSVSLSQGDSDLTIQIIHAGYLFRLKTWQVQQWQNNFLYVILYFKEKLDRANRVLVAWDRSDEIAPFAHEGADTRMLLHTADATRKGFR